MEPRDTNEQTTPRADAGGTGRVEPRETSAIVVSRIRNRNLLAGAAAGVVLILLLAFALTRGGGARSKDEHAGAEAGETHGEAGGEGDTHAEDEATEVALSPEALEEAGIETEAVTERAAVGLLRTPGTVEVNQEQTQQATPLVGGRVERVAAGTGDRVRAGDVLAVISSPEVAQLHGKLHEAETRVALAERNLDRVLKAENRVGVVSAKARLDEAEATLRRTRRLVELGAGAGKDLTAAETAYTTARAEYEFQSNVALNKEVQEARAELVTARVDAAHIRDEMRAFGAPVPEGDDHDHDKNSSLVAVRAPVSGVVTERLVNPGAGVEAGKPLFTISNTSTVWVIARIPEARLGLIRTGVRAEVTSAAIGDRRVSGRVSYIDPQLDETTRTAKVRLEVANPGEALKAGMFVEVGFETGAPGGEASEIREPVVPSEAVQRLGDQTVVFVPKEGEPSAKPGRFEVRKVELGGEASGYRRVLSGLEAGERVVTKGSFTLKAQLMKGELEHDDH